MSLATSTDITLDLRADDVVVRLTPIPRVADPAALPAPRPTLSRLAEPSVYQACVKPLFDRVVAAVLLVVLAPVFAVIAVAVACSLGRPILFRQQRIGLGGRAFTVLKFRTMLPEQAVDVRSVEERLASYKRGDDPRVTPIGRFLRRSSLDEIPQLFNVLRGEMSLVGPRPELPWIVDTYAPGDHRRHDVRPGMTGLWQITARGEGPMHRAVNIDLDYVARQSARTDFAILLRTPVAALGACRGI